MAPGAANRTGLAASLLQRLGRRHRLLRAGGLVALVRILGLGCAFLLQVLLARLLGDPSAYGSYAWGQSLLFLLGGLAALGMPVAASRFTAVLLGRGDEAGARRVLQRARAHLVRVGVLLLALAILCLVAGPPRFGEGLPSALVATAIGGAPLVAWMNLNQQVTRARGWLLVAFLPTHVVRPTLTALFALASWWVLGAPREPVHYLVLVAASLACVLLLQEPSLRAVPAVRAPAGRESEPDGEYSPEQLLSVGLPLLLIRFSGLVTKHGSTLLLGLLAGPAAAGVFFAARRLAELALLPQQVAAAVTQPMLARAYAERTVGRFERLAWINTHMAFWPTCLAALLMLVFGTSILTLFGRDFTAAMPVLGLLLLAQVIAVGFGAGRDVLVMAGLQRPLSVVTLLLAVLHLAVLALLLREYGALGAAAAHCLHAIASGLSSAVMARRRAGVRITLWSALGLLRSRPGPESEEGSNDRVL